MQNLQLADGGKRFIAFLIDTILLGVVTVILVSIIGMVSGVGAASAVSNSGDMSDSQAAGIMAVMAGAGLLIQLISLALQVGYFTYMESSE